MATIQTTEDLARVLWARAMAPWFQARPDHAIGVPTFEPRAVRFDVVTPRGPLSFRVVPSDGRPAAVRGEDLSVVALGPPPDATAFDALARAIAAVRVPLALPTEEPRRGSGQRVELFVVDGCNLRCFFCCESKRIERNRFMPWDELEAKLREAADHGVSVIQFMGGEASLHPRFGDALRLCKDLGLGTYTITNLLRWEDRRFADAVAPYLDEVMISMHAYGGEAGADVTGRTGWWRRFGRAAENARATLHARTKCSTVLSRHNVDALEDIAGELLSFRPTTWVMGNGVPIVDSRLDPVAEGLTLTEQRALVPRFRALRERCESAGCDLLFFCMPHCVLGPDLWDTTHDAMLGDQDLGDAAPSDAADVHFWSRADWLDVPKSVTLGRKRPEKCAQCERRAGCGGYFSRYLDRHGDDELVPVLRGS